MESDKNQECSVIKKKYKYYFPTDAMKLLMINCLNNKNKKKLFEFDLPIIYL